MSERPILFSGPMVRAILDGRKTQTRRIVRDQPAEPCGKPWPYPANGRPRWIFDGAAAMGAEWLCPYGVPGDRLWVRETFGVPDAPYEEKRQALVVYRADETPRMAELNRHFWRTSIHMPRWASRLTLEITDVRVQRLQEISEDDADAEGCEFRVGEPYDTQDRGWVTPRSTPRQEFERLWDSINGKRAPWASNPWVWALTFRKAA